MRAEMGGVRGNLDRRRRAADRRPIRSLRAATGRGRATARPRSACIVREALTGEAGTPARTPRASSSCASWIEGKAGGRHRGLADRLDDQRAFQALSLDLLRHLDLTRPEPTDRSDGEDGRRGRRRARRRTRAGTTRTRDRASRNPPKWPPNCPMATATAMPTARRSRAARRWTTAIPPTMPKRG